MLSGALMPVVARSVYSRVGDLFGWACVVLVAAALVRRPLRRSASREGDG